MKTPIKPAVNLKRASLTILLLMFVIIGLQSQKSINYRFYCDSDSFRKAFLRIIKMNEQHEIDEYAYYTVDNEPDIKILPITDNMYITIEVVTGISAESRIIREQAKEEEMEVECWMLNDFNVKRRNIDLSVDEVVNEEEMQIEDWMLNPDKWVTASRNM